MSVIRAELTSPGSVSIDVTITATLAEWKALRALIIEHKDDLAVSDGLYCGTKEPFWSLIHRLGDVIAAVEKQHANYGS